MCKPHYNRGDRVQTVVRGKDEWGYPRWQVLRMVARPHPQRSYLAWHVTHSSPLVGDEDTAAALLRVGLTTDNDAKPGRACNPCRVKT